MSSRSKDIIFLLGAGTSAEAGIPTSAAMISKLEEKVHSDKDWGGFSDLYNHVKSAVLYKDGLAGRFGDGASYNIELLVNTLYELERNEEHPLYPFIAAWNARFVSLAGDRFARVRELRHRILQLLKQWVCPDDPTEGAYYAGLISAQRAFTFPLRIFSLNYDLCVERLHSAEFVVETGFSGFGPKHVWSYERFIDIERGENPPPQAFLYKLHGSIDWKRDPKTKTLSRVEQVHPIPPDEMEIIFGREAKLEAADPYLFYAYEFRQCAIETKLVVAIGYSFSDPHINKIISQALKVDAPKTLIVVSKCEEERTAQFQSQLATRLEVDLQRIRIERGTAKDFLDRSDLGQMLLDAVPQAESPPF
jgi:SIR2-like domain